MAATSRHTYGLLLFILVLSGCSTITATQPTDPSRYAEIDVVVKDGKPEAVIQHVAAYTGFGSKDFFTSLDQKEPRKLFLDSGKYALKVVCYPLYGEPVESSELDISVEGGKKYWLGCHDGLDYHHVYLQ